MRPLEHPSARPPGQHLVIAIDGPAGSGKSTVARRVADTLGCTLLDTGAIYRSLALLAHERGIALDDGPAVAALAPELGIRFQRSEGQNRVFLEEREVTAQIRTPDISLGASQVSALPEVREALLGVQRAAADAGPLVAEGRDMGTVVFPAARVKVFLDADPRERARRRHAELVAKGDAVSLAQVLAQQNARDEADSARAVAPLRPADDAVVLDTSQLAVDQVVERVLALVPR